MTETDEREQLMVFPASYGAHKSRASHVQPHAPINVSGEPESLQWLEETLRAAHERRQNVEEAVDELSDLICYLQDGYCPIKPADHARRFLNRLKDIKHLLKEN